MVAFVVPIGHSLGPYFPDGAADAETFRVKVGANIYNLDHAQYGVWALAFGMPELVQRRAPTRAQLEEQARESGLPEPGPVLTQLINDGLLVSLMPVESQLKSFAQQHQMHALAFGLGNSAENPAQYTIGMPGDPYTVVDATVYALWSSVSSYPSLWEAALEFASSANNRELANEGRTFAARGIINILVEQLPILLATNCIYIDRRI